MMSLPQKYQNKQKKESKVVLDALLFLDIESQWRILMD